MPHPRKLVQDGQIIADQFRLEQQLGKGGMGTVWRAEDMRLGRPVAIKFLSSEFLNDEQARMRFAREPRLASKIRSPHVVQVYAQGTTDDDVPYLVMELLEGEDLATYVSRAGPLNLAETGRIVEQMCRALSRAHREGLVHRDIKPHNIFLTPEPDGQMFVKLLDFGIAKDVRAPVTSLTLSGEVVGSALYVSPEQLHEAHSVGPSTDIWALGIVIYEMLTARVPFDGRSLPELFVRVVEGNYKPVTHHEPALPKTVDTFFTHVIQRDPAQRFQSIDELGAAFARIVRANSSGFLVKPDDPQPSAARSSRRPRPDQQTTDRMPRPWSRVLLITLALCLGLAGAAIVAAFLTRDDPQAAVADPEAVEPAAGAAEPREPAADEPLPAVDTVIEEAPAAPPARGAPTAVAAPSEPEPEAPENRLQPPAASDKPRAKAGTTVEPRWKPRPPAVAPNAPQGKPAPRPSELDMPHNHGF